MTEYTGENAGKYTVEDTLQVARRFNNSKRPWLLVNPLQAKHIPASPGDALAMMNSLGERLARRYPDCRLVIGFAETATAIGAAVAGAFAGDCIYLPTTREELPGEAVRFLEEHSHAVEQQLCAGGLAGWLERTPSVIFVDDELSTGKTLLNMIGQLREAYPGLAAKKLVAASVLNRLSREAEQRLMAAGVACEYLVKVPELAALEAVAALAVQEAPPAGEAPGLAAEGPGHKPLPCSPLPDPRQGVQIGAYQESCRRLAAAFGELLRSARADVGESVVVLGTEECMYPALVLGCLLESRGHRVRCHATTRSPIGICREPGYPIVSGCRLKSFYDESRPTYIYNLGACDTLIVVSDAADGQAAWGELAAAWAEYGWKNTYYIQSKQGESNVWYLQKQ